MTINKEIGWNVIIKNESYKVTFASEPYPFKDGKIKIKKMYSLKKGVFKYILSIFENGTYRLYSCGLNKCKLRLKGATSKIKFVPALYFVERQIATQ